MSFDPILALVERLRKKAIGEPNWLDEKHAFEYAEHSAKVVAVLKLVRASHSLNALDLLRQHGLFIDFGVIMRCMYDCEMEIYFLLENFQNSSNSVNRFVKSFFETEIDGYLTAETHVVQSKKLEMRWSVYCGASITRKQVRRSKGCIRHILATSTPTTRT